MSTIRTTILSVVLVLVIAATVLFAAVPLPAMAAQSGANCPVPAASTSSFSASSLSTQQLWSILNGRYERRNGLPY